MHYRCIKKGKELVMVYHCHSGKKHAWPILAIAHSAFRCIYRGQD